MTNEQKSDILKYERDFKRNVTKLKDERLSEENFVAKYNQLKEERNVKMRSVLNESQINTIENF